MSRDMSRDIAADAAIISNHRSHHHRIQIERGGRHWQAAEEASIHWHAEQVENGGGGGGHDGQQQPGGGDGVRKASARAEMRGVYALN